VSLLDEIAPPAERIFVGKDPERHTVTQEVINELLGPIVCARA